MELHYKPLQREQIPQLTPLMKAAFDEDTRLHTQQAEGGPWGYADGRLLERLLAQKDSSSQVIFCQQRPIGEYTVFWEGDRYTLDMLFLAPEYEGKGLGKQVWQDIEAAFPKAKSWFVETPAESRRNLRFYESCGFRRVRVHTYEDGAQSVILARHRKKGQLEICRYQEERDYEAVLALCQEEGWDSFCTRQKEAYRQALRGSVTYTAHEDGRLCGYLRALTDGFVTLYGCELLVEEVSRRKGVGRALLEAVRRDYPGCCVDVLSDADDFYKANGFLRLGSGMRLLPYSMKRDPFEQENDF